MKRNTYLLFLISISLIFTTCSDKNQLIGIWDDNIKLSAKTVDFKASADSVIITTEGNWWWVTHVAVDNVYFHVTEDINTEADNYTFSNDCFVVERRDKNTLFIKVDENQLNIQRIIVIELEAGDYFDRVTIKQAGM